LQVQLIWARRENNDGRGGGSMVKAVASVGGIVGGAVSLGRHGGDGRDGGVRMRTRRRGKRRCGGLGRARRKDQLGTGLTDWASVVMQPW
jgi:hypothetical protein